MIGWIVKNGDEFQGQSLASSAKTSKILFLNSTLAGLAVKEWKTAFKRGYHCVKVTVSEVKLKKKK